MPDSNSTVGGYTPGPWHVEHRIHVKAENGYRVATVNVPSGRVGSIEVNPFDNARLIAAAPDMLQAGERLLAWWEAKIHKELASHKDFPWAEDAEWSEFQAMRAAIAKATGGQS